MAYSQKAIYEYLKANPLGVDVQIGDLESLNGKDYIFVDYTYDYVIPYDNTGMYKTVVQITVATRDYEDRRTLTEYIKKYMNCEVNYDKSSEYDYWMARCTATILLH